MPEGNLWTRLFIQRVLFKESESKSIVSSDISRMAWISKDGFFMDQSCVFINHETVHMYILSDGNARKDHAVLNYSARFDHTSTSDDGVLDSSSIRHPLETTEFLTSEVSKYCVGQESLVLV